MGAVAGKVMPRPRGPYDATVVYDVIDMVTLSNKLWIAKRSGIQGVEPSVDSEDWMLAVDGTTDVKALEVYINEHFENYDQQIEDLNNTKADKPTILEITLDTTNWTAETDETIISLGCNYRYSYMTIIPFDDVTDVSANIAIKSKMAAKNAKMLDMVEYIDNGNALMKLSFFAETVPTAEILVTVKVEY